MPLPFRTFRCHQGCEGNTYSRRRAGADRCTKLLKLYASRVFGQKYPSACVNFLVLARARARARTKPPPALLRLHSRSAGLETGPSLGFPLTTGAADTQECDACVMASFYSLRVSTPAHAAKRQEIEKRKPRHSSTHLSLLLLLLLLLLLPPVLLSSQ
ncbi:unnamed protein product [Schistocephalus solidus]|uniref:Transmembrane protein n=1 Tax=Schistocephalus solidus TaxID=70667 RepID=A0A183SQR1_SCHSO|nr:unnamed protein product [Schistocephalus solidus]